MLKEIENLSLGVGATNLDPFRNKSKQQHDFRTCMINNNIDVNDKKK